MGGDPLGCTTSWEASCQPDHTATYRPSLKSVTHLLELTLAEVISDLKWKKLTLITDFLDGKKTI